MENLSCSEITKQKIAKALKELMENNAFEKITVSDITNKCGIHRQTFYYHFQDRYELLDWLIYSELIDPLLSDFSFENMYSKFYNIFVTMNESKKFYQSALTVNSNDLSRYIGKIATEQFSQVVIKIGESNGIEIDESGDLLISEFFGYGLSGVVLNWVSRGMKETPHEMTSKIEMLVNACKKIAINRV